jgi:hypothetical protein
MRTFASPESSAALVLVVLLVGDAHAARWYASTGAWLDGGGSSERSAAQRVGQAPFAATLVPELCATHALS